MICDSYFFSRGVLSSLHKLRSGSLLPLHMEQRYIFNGAGNTGASSSHSLLHSKMNDTCCFASAFEEVRPKLSFLSHHKMLSFSSSNCKHYSMRYFSAVSTMVAKHPVGQKKAAFWRALMSHGTHFVHLSTDSCAKQRNEEWSGLVVCPENRLKQPSLTVAVDIDEVLGSFLMALNTFIAEQYLRDHNISEFHVYDFTKVWQCSRAEADLRVHSFFKSKHFDEGILPIPGAYKALLQISSFCNLCVVTSRQNIIKEETLAWIDRHYSGIFSEVHFGNHFALEGEARTKSDICRGVGAEVLIDDNPVYALDCARSGMEVLLFDFNNSYPWSKTQGLQHPSITRVHNWEEVESILRQKSSKVQA